MLLLPGTRRARIAAAAIGCVLVTAVVAVLVSGDEDDQATTRTSSPVTTGTSVSTTAASVADPSSTTTVAPTTTSKPASAADLPLPVVRRAPRADGTAPAIRLGELFPIEGPSAVVDPPGAGPILVSSLDGRIRRVDLASGSASTVLDLGDIISTGGERGLLGMAADPRGERLYVDFTDTEGNTRVRSWPLGPDGGPTGGSVEHLRIDQPFANHNGGNLVVGPDGALWIGTGDGGSGGDPGDVAQDEDELLGKMLRIVPNPAGGLIAPSTNPRWGSRREVWGIGLRNPWRYSFDRATNRLWIADVGQGTVEEVTVVDPTEPKPNFGWDDVEGNLPFEGEPSPAFTAPAVTYGHDDGCSITGGYVYRGDANPGLYGWYLFGDYCGGWVRAVPSTNPTARPVELLAGVGGALSFAELEDGELLLLTGDGIRRLLAT